MPSRISDLLIVSNKITASLHLLAAGKALKAVCAISNRLKRQHLLNEYNILQTR